MVTEDRSMARNMREASAATMWQLEVFVAAVETGDWARVEQRLGVDRYRCRKAVDRLAVRLGAEKLLPRIGDRFLITERDRDLARDARRMLETYEQMRSDAGGSERLIVVRFAAYPAQLKRFAAQAVGEFETENANVRVELHDLEGRRRRGGGVRSATQIRDRELDMVIAAVGFGEDPPPGIAYADLYGWRLLAVSRNSDELFEGRVRYGSAKERLLDVADLAGRRLLVAPKGHRSRDMLDLFAEQDPTWNVTAESEDPEVLVRIATYSDKVAVVPSDSVPAMSSAWPTLVARGHGVLGGKYRALWRDSDSDPRRLRALTCDLAARLVSRAEALRGQIQGSLSPTTSEKSWRD